MFKTFTKLAQMNVDHYNNHPAQHAILTGVAGAVAVVGIITIPKRIAGVPKN